jgi:5-methylcytosine-specific restriction endonuclease McrA
MRKNCCIKNCGRKYLASNYCRMHYLRWYRQGNAGEVEARKVPDGTYKLNAKNRSEYGRKYRQLKEIKSLPSMNKIRFGGLREQIIQRDGERCVLCKMTRTEHRLMFDRDITINHIDHQSTRSSKFDGTINNDPDNLVTLCLPCHGSVDAIKSGKYATYHKRISAESG